ncbi:MAG: CvpA family protein [Gammaproteobacteria bacterium]|nr:CvpA family protein [Gammaproteobacteria bacterium]
MAVADISILIIIVISMLLGLWRGLVKEAFSLAAWITAVFVAGFFSAPLADLMINMLDNATVRRVLASAIIFILVMFIGAFLGNFMSKLSTAIGLKGVDKALGSLFGVLRGTIIVLLVLFLTTPFEFSQPWYQDSIFVPYMMIVLENLAIMADYDLTVPAVDATLIDPTMIDPAMIDPAAIGEIL